MDLIIAGLLAVLCTWIFFRPGKKRVVPAPKRQRRHGELHNHKPSEKIRD